MFGVAVLFLAHCFTPYMELVHVAATTPPTRVNECMINTEQSLEVISSYL